MSDPQVDTNLSAQPKEEGNKMNEELLAKLKGLGLKDEEVQKLAGEGVANDSDMARLNADQIKAVTSCGLVTAMKVAEAFVPAPNPVVVSDPGVGQMASMDMLPSVPDDSSFLEMLKVGGVLKVGKVEVISAMRAAIATQVGLYNLPDILMTRMERFAEEQDEPVGESFYTLQRLITSRNYGEVLSVLGVTGNFVSDRRKNEVLARLNSILWPALRNFNSQLVAWSDAWSKGMSNPGAALMVLAMASGGGARGVMPPGMLQPPETAGLRDEAEAVINQINKVFSGTGIPVARALAFDATRIKGILEEPTLPAAVGSATRDQMLKTLGVDVGPDYVRLERNVTRFALSIMELPNISSGNEEYGYLGSMLQLGLSIPWEKLGGSTPSPVRSSRKTTEEVGSLTGSSFRSGRD